MDGPTPLLGDTDVPNGSSYHTVRASKDISAQDVDIKEAWRQALEDRGGEDAGYGADDIDVEHEESERDLK